MIPINEVFETLQGEAHYTGTPSLFIRLHGCDVGCAFCDTKHTWKIEKTYQIPLESMLLKSVDAPTYALCDVEELVAIEKRYQARHIVLTGGEPCNYDLVELTAKLLRAGRTVQIETSGTRDVLAHWQTWVTVSPKYNMAGGYKVLRSALERANEIKMPVGKQSDVDKVLEVQRSLPNCPPIWLQPLSQSEKATGLCVAAATKHGWRVSIQTHKFIGLR